MSRAGDYFIIGVLGGFMAGSTLMIKLVSDSYKRQIRDSQISEAYYRDINQDDKRDIIVTQGNGRRHGFLQQEDGTYISLDAFKQQQLDALARTNSALESNVRIQIGRIEQDLMKGVEK